MKAERSKNVGDYCLMGLLLTNCDSATSAQLDFAKKKNLFCLDSVEKRLSSSRCTVF